MQYYQLISSTLSDLAQARHIRRETGEQCHGWQAQIHPWSLDTLRALTGPAQICLKQICINPT
jgi:hypothetical protein